MTRRSVENATTSIVEVLTSKRTLLCLVATIALSGCGSQRETKESSVVAAVEKLGGKVEVEAASFGQPVTKVQLHGTNVTDGDLAQLEPLTRIKSLSLGRTRITDAGLVHLRELRSLQTLSLNQTTVSDEGLRNLCLLKNLRTLNVQDTLVTEEGVRELKRMLPQVAIGYSKRD